MRKVISIGLVVFLLLAAVALSSLNASAVAINLYWYQWSLPLGFLLLLFAVAGLMAGLVIAAVWWLWPAKKEAMHWRRQFHQLNDTHSQVVVKDNEPGTDLTP